jgi:hypothetical protein
MSHSFLPLVAAVALVSGVASAEPAAANAAPRATVVGQAPANPADAIVGDWKPADMPVTVRIFPAQGQYLGGIVAAENPALVNKEMFRGITYDAASNTWRGEVFALKRGDFVPMTIRTTPAGFEMVAGSGLMSKTIEWVRAQ